jgi:TolB-like protein
MSGNPGKLSQFWQELKRRKVVHVITVYATAAFVIIELVNNVVEPLNLPDRTPTFVIILLIIGFPLAVILSWVFDLTPKGVEKTKPLSESQEGEKQVTPNGWKIATIVSFVVIIGLIIFNLVGGSKQLRAGDIQSLVVLPFDNFTGDEDLEYFVSGMHSSLIGDMGKIGGLRVISTTSSNSYKNADMSVPQIASELNVEAVVEAQVMCLGDSICVQFRLISVFPEEEQIWIADYKEEKNQILNLYNRVTKQIADQVMIELTADEESLLAQVRTVDKEAYDAYLRGRSYWDDLSMESLTKALEYLNLAVEKDPAWAAPYAGIAQVWAGLAQMGFATHEIAGPKIFENLNKALELDPDFADSHFINAVIGVWVEWNWEKGEKEFLRALVLNPSDALSRVYYGHLLMILQRPEEARMQGQLAVDIDPLNLVLSLYAVILNYLDDLQTAMEYLEKALAMDPEDYFANNIMEFSAKGCGEYEKSIEALKNYLPLHGIVTTEIERTYNEQGFEPAYDKTLNLMEIAAQKGMYSPADLAMRFLIRGYHEKGIDYYETGFEMHDQNMPYISTFAGDNYINSNPRFLAILEKMNLPLPKE